MKPEEISKMIDAVSQYGELLSGMKNQLVNQGFSEEIAEQLVLEMIKRAL